MMSLTIHAKKIALSTLAIAIAVGAYFAFAAPQAQALENLSNINSGDLIKGESFSSVYYMGADGFRYVFTNDKAYFTWYTDFSTVKTISDADLMTVQIGGNITYRPGVKMVKITSDPSTYAVSKGGVLRHVGSEAIAVELYGSDWNTKIDDVPDSFFPNYSIGSAIESAGQFSPSGETSAVSSINSDKTLSAPADISITDSGYSPIDVTINAGQGVRFTNNGSMNHTVTADDLTWGSGTLTPGQSSIKTFKQSGTFPFFDSYDSQNTGAVYAQ